MERTDSEAVTCGVCSISNHLVADTGTTVQDAEQATQREEAGKGMGRIQLLTVRGRLHMALNRSRVGAEGTQVVVDKELHHEADTHSKEQDTPGDRGSG